MIETGLTRKIDGLGRLVIPKEIRERFNIKENDYLEFLISNEGFFIKRYSKLSNFKVLAQELVDTLNNYLNAEVFIADSDSIIAYSGINKKRYLNKKVSNSIIKAIKRRESLFEKYNKDICLIEGNIINCSYIDETLVANSEEIGIICLYRLDNSVNEIDRKIVNIVASFLTKYLEE